MALIVDQTSATYGRPNEYKDHHVHGLALNHKNLVRFKPNDDNYGRVRYYLEDFAQKAHGIIGKRLEINRQGEDFYGYHVFFQKTLNNE